MNLSSIRSDLLKMEISCCVVVCSLTFSSNSDKCFRFWMGFRHCSKMSALYMITHISDCKFFPELGHFKFLVHWEATEDHPNPDPQWEPIEHLMECPLLVLEYEKQCREQWKSDCKAGRGCIGGKAMRRQNPVDKIPTILPGQHDLEGIERLHKICVGMHVGEETGKDEPGYLNMFLVQLRGGGRVKHWVHRAYLEYYFPTRLALHFHAAETKKNAVAEKAKQLRSSVNSGRGRGRGRRGKFRGRQGGPQGLQ